MTTPTEPAEVDAVAAVLNEHVLYGDTCACGATFTGLRGISCYVRHLSLLSVRAAAAARGSV